jgi:hypothetical protein
MVVARGCATSSFAESGSRSRAPQRDLWSVEAPYGVPASRNLESNAMSAHAYTEDQLVEQPAIAASVRGADDAFDLASQLARLLGTRNLLLSCLLSGQIHGESIA